jgi:two-component system response regulator RegX3
VSSRILVVEDERPIREGLLDRFGREGFSVTGARDGEEATAALARDAFDLVVLDLMLPGMDGEEVLQRMRDQGDRTPVLVLSARGQEIDRVLLFTLGADDYVVKPFSVRELVLRVKAILRRASPGTVDGGIAFGDVTVDLEGYRVTRGADTHPLTATERGMLVLLWRRRGRAVPREDFLKEVWGYASVPETRTVDFHVVRLRKKIEADPESPRHLVTVRGVGYRLDVGGKP